MTPQPCPFCGGINILQEGYHLFCYACGANGPDADNDDDEERAAAWNTRAALASQAQPVPEAIESLVSALAESRGWMRDYSKAIIEDAIEREQPDSFHLSGVSGCAATAQPAKPAEIRNNSLGKLDEFFADNADIHLEQMNDGHWWMGVTMPDGAMWHLNFSTKRNTAISVLAECDAPAAPGSAATDRPRSDEKESCAPAVSALPQQPVAYQRLVDGKWVECSYFVAYGWSDTISPNCRALYAAPPPPPPVEGEQHG